MTPAESARRDTLARVGLEPLMALTKGHPAITVGLIDGPVALTHPDLAEARLIHLASEGACRNPASAACRHGTFAAGSLFARRSSAALALCPGCTGVLRPLFTEDRATGVLPSARPAELASAMLDCLRAGVRVINLSLAFVGPDQDAPTLEQALDEVARKGVLVVAAAGNDGRVGGTRLTRHPAVIAVMGCDAQGRPSGYANLGLTIGRHGLRAPASAFGLDSAGGEFIREEGTSVAAPIVTGAIALLWSCFPTATAGQIKAALTQGRARRSIVPPLLHAWSAYRYLSHANPIALGFIGNSRGVHVMEFPAERKTLRPANTVGEDAPPAEEPFYPPDSPAPSPAERTPCHCEQWPSSGGKPTYVYAVGRLEARFPRLDIEKEYRQAAARMLDKNGKTDQELFWEVLGQPNNRYLLRQLCWVMTVQGLETYIVQPRNPMDFDVLLQAIRPVPDPYDIDVVIGVLGPLAAPETCNGLLVPLVGFDQLYSFSRDDFIESLPVPAGLMEEPLKKAASEVFDLLTRLADNAGASDEHRAVNYLVMRYPVIYSKTTEKFGQGFSLAAVTTRPSNVSTVRRVIDVIFTFANRENTEYKERFLVRVDVTEEFPFLITPWSPYFDRQSH